jgi:hypothetical protein
MTQGSIIHSEDDWKSGQVEDGPCKSLDDCKKKLYSLVVLKDVVAEGVWYWLAGNLTISVTQNYILNSGCQTSAATMKKRHDEYLRMVEKHQDDENHPLGKDKKAKTRTVKFM